MPEFWVELKGDMMELMLGQDVPPVAPQITLRAAEAATC